MKFTTEFQQDRKDPKVTNRVLYKTDDFQVAGDETGIQLCGTLNIESDEHLNIFAQVIAEAYKNHVLFYERKKGQIVLL